MASKAPTRLRLSSEDRKASIVEAAARLFAEKGFRGTTTRELAAAVGVTEPILYEHFKTKKDLYTAIIDAKSCQGIERIQQLCKQFSTIEDDKGFFLQLGRLIFDWYTVDPTLIRLLLYSNLEGHDLKDLLEERQGSAFFNSISAFIEKRMKEGAMLQGDPAVAARAFIGMVGHYALTGIVFKFRPLSGTNDEILANMVSIFMNGICRRNPE